MKAGSFVLVHLSNPREKFWGLLEQRDASGVTVRGLAVEGFEEWLREITREAAPSFSPATVFFPLQRVVPAPGVQEQARLYYSPGRQLTPRRASAPRRSSRA